MCGIAFVINYGQAPLPPDFVQRLFSNMDDRGGDASGIYFERAKKGRTIRRLAKGPITGEDLFAELHDARPDQTKHEKAFNSKYGLDGSERLVLLHTRKRTHGSEYDNNNNMPIYSKDWILVHNGVVSADRLTKYPYRGVVDSEEILARIQMYGGDFSKAIPEVSGSMSLIAKKFSDPELYLYRNSNPLDLVFQPETNILVGVSNAEYAMDFSLRKDMNSFFKERGIATCQTTPNILYRVSLLKPGIEAVGSISSRGCGSDSTTSAATKTGLPNYTEMED